MFKHILLPTDGTELSEEAIKKAVAFAKSVGARISGFHAIQEYSPVLASESFGYFDPATVELFEKNAEAYARNCLSFIEKSAQEAGVDCDCSFETSPQVYEGIIKAAQDNDCDLIWMASHGRRGITGLLVGSETSKVLTHSKIPVLVYR
ncbi:MAG: universal stress protein [Burkholderiales bacterium]|nr:universal stress protein [Burkholderiales bacterium]